MGIVFNSRARGDHKADSGALLTGLHNSTVNTMFEMIDATYAVELERGIIVSSLLPTWQNQWDHPEQFSNPGLLRNIQREGVRL
jgi:hypothetical protein